MNRLLGAVLLAAAVTPTGGCDAYLRRLTATRIECPADQTSTIQCEDASARAITIQNR